VKPHLALPSEDSPDGALARQLATLLGPVVQGADGTAVAADLLAFAGALADARQALRDLADEAFADAAHDLLPEHERAYGLPVREDLAPADRRARLVAKHRAARAGDHTDIPLALRALDPTVVSMAENTPAAVPREADTTIPPVAGAHRQVYRFGIQLAVDVWNDEDTRAQIARLLEQMKPAHTAFTLHTNIPGGFFCDDPDSLTDRDIVGG
jgi:uncharacterized protein YmfQ (DUF2313 family)